MTDRILLIEDDMRLAEMVRDYLDGAGFRVTRAGNGNTGLTLHGRETFDAIILDLMLPDMDGLDLLRSLRQAGSNVPVIVLTARDDDVDVIVGLELGADDYVIKPFNPRELAARVRAVLRRRAEALALAARLASLEQEPRAPAADSPTEGLYFDPPARRAWFAGQLLDLRLREYDLLHFLAQHQGQVISRTTLLQQVWGCDEFIDDRTVDVHIHHLRQKLAEIDPGADLIQTERGIGYRLVE